ncbi:MAG TPA: hydroxymethylglutaryl-CoA reductase, degradative [Chloroflexi bacterium]|nr:MAG: hydroxymethylglutaryl-CoA reductase, degradative [Anaerolineaceae bacterium 4572_5.2]HEY83647.1 hydroxymethylglutaryl-CoA reductase, degradative [Chloroflexota bacterium]
MSKSVRLSGLYKYSLEKRANVVAEWASLKAEEKAALINGLPLSMGDGMIENVIGLYNLPLGIATNFLINGEEVIVPMAVEEPSIVAGLSYAAKLTRSSGGFRTSSSQPVMIGQLQVLGLSDLDEAVTKLKAIEAELLEKADHDPIIRKFGGGAKGFEFRPLPDTAVGPMLIVHILYDCRDAMGANTVNTAAEIISPIIEKVTGGRVNLRIISNLADRRTATAECTIKAGQLARGDMDEAAVVQGIVEAWAFAKADPYRAATHNKGIMNGIDAVAIATGNDWRAIEAGAHAFAARNGRYTSLTEWRRNEDGDLAGRLHLPLAVGTVGGATKVHPAARASIKILGNPSARRLAEIMAAVGLGQNLAAIRALATEGIQRGHMRLHARQVALAAGATPEQAQEIANQLVAEGNIKEARAKEILKNSE